MVLLKLVLVPALLFAVSKVGERFGATVAGWLAGLPLVGGPILFFMAVEQGATFAAQAACASLAAVSSTVCFGLCYAWSARFAHWAGALFIALLGWLLSVYCIAWTAPGCVSALVATMVTLLVAPRLFPPVVSMPRRVRLPPSELGCRMLAGAILIVVVTRAAHTVGPTWSGLLGVFPVLTIVLAVFSHRSISIEFCTVLLRALVPGLYSYAAFCFIAAAMLPHVGIATGLTLALGGALMIHATVAGTLVLTRRLRPSQL